MTKKTQETSNHQFEGNRQFRKPQLERSGTWSCYLGLSHAQKLSRERTLMRARCLVCIFSILIITSATAQTPDELIQRLKQPEARVRRLAAEALGKQKVEDAIPALVELLKDGDREVRAPAGEALERIGPKAVPALVGALSYPEATSRLAALDALARLAPMAREAQTKETLAVVSAALKDKDVDVRIHAAFVLEKTGAAASPVAKIEVAA